MKNYIRLATLFVVMTVGLFSQVTNTVVSYTLLNPYGYDWRNVWYLQDGRSFILSKGNVNRIDGRDVFTEQIDVVKGEPYKFTQYSDNEAGLISNLQFGYPIKEIAYRTSVSNPNNMHASAWGAAIFRATNQSGCLNFSCRTNLSAGERSTLGFVIGNLREGLYLIRAAGKSLKQFGLTNVVDAPGFKIFDSTQRMIASGSNWNATAASREAFSAMFQLVGAFQFADDSSENVYVCNLYPGAYTVEFDNTKSTSGECLLEVYELPYIH